MKRIHQAFKYVFFDFVGSFIAWFLFFYFRKTFIEPQVFGSYVKFEVDRNLLAGLIVFPIFWVMLFWVNSFYKDVYRRSRLKELGTSISVTFIGVLIIFFIFLLDDYVASYRNYYQLFFALFTLQFLFTYFPRLLITSRTIIKIRKRIIGFPTVIVGDGEGALRLYNEIESQNKFLGSRIVGFISTGFPIKSSLKGVMPNLGHYKELKNLIGVYGIEEVILAVENKDNRVVSQIVSDLLGLDVQIKAIPSMYDYLTGRVKISSIIGTPLIHVSFDLMPLWQQKIKLLLDVFLSIIALIVFLPFLLILTTIIKATSKGSIFYAQERVGHFGKPFMIYKFRSMYVDAEKNGPALSSQNDNRITPIGKFLRRTRLDEVPNFWNVIKGDMSLVGPRPERQFYIDQIVKKAPHYVYLQKVKPGITSWGQVKFGYAENVDEMVERLKYDLLYLENMTLFVDFKIMIYTLITVFRGRGV